MSILCICDRSSLFPRCDKNPDYCTKIDPEYSPKVSLKQEEDVWATQICYAKAKAISFEE